MIMYVGKGALGASINSQNKKAPDILDRMTNFIEIHDFYEFSRFSGSFVGSKGARYVLNVFECQRAPFSSLSRS